MTTRTIPHAALVQLAETSTDAVIALDSEDRICLFNPAAEAAFGLSAEAVCGRVLMNVPELAQVLMPLRGRALTGEGTVCADVDLDSGAKIRTQVIITPERPNKPLFKDADDRLVLMHEVVHKLKVPISAAKGFLDLVMALGDLNDQQLTFVHRAQVKLLGMVTQVHEVLDTFWMESGGKVHLQTTDLGPLIQQTSEDLADYAMFQGVEIVVDLPSESSPVQADSARIYNAITNLVHNAIKYSPGGGVVHVGLSTDDHRVVLRVEDHGLGIPPEYLPRLFQPFYRVRTAETRRIEGSGLGLAIVKAIVEKHQGEVFVESTPGEGSVFGFSLPLSV